LGPRAPESVPLFPKKGAEIQEVLLRRRPLGERDSHCRGTASYSLRLFVEIARRNRRSQTNSLDALTSSGSRMRRYRALFAVLFVLGFINVLRESYD